MQLNVYVPKDKVGVVKLLEETAKKTGRQKNELVLDALERYLGRTRPQLPAYHLGGAPFSREELYEERLDWVMAPSEQGAGETKT